MSDEAHTAEAPSTVGPPSMHVPPSTPTVIGRLARALARGRALRARIVRARGRSKLLDATFETIERDSEIGGGILAGALAYRLFLFALPLAFALVSWFGVLARVLGIDPRTLGDDLGLPRFVAGWIAGAADSSWSFLVALTSFAVLLHMTVALLRAVAIVHGLAWERSAATVKVSRRALGVFAGAVAGQLALVGGAGAVREQSAVGGIGALPVFMLGIASLWLLVSLELPHTAARWTKLVPGALLYGACVLALQVFNAYLLERLLDAKTSTYGALGVAAAILLCFVLLGRSVVAAAVLNSTLFERDSRAGGGGS